MHDSFTISTRMVESDLEEVSISNTYHQTLWHHAKKTKILANYHWPRMNIIVLEISFQTFKLTCFIPDLAVLKFNITENLRCSKMGEVGYRLTKAKNTRCQNDFWPQKTLTACSLLIYLNYMRCVTKVLLQIQLYMVI